jgi:hypothetical protein
MSKAALGDLLMERHGAAGLAHGYASLGTALPGQYPRAECVAFDD